MGITTGETLISLLQKQGGTLRSGTLRIDYDAASNEHMLILNSDSSAQRRQVGVKVIDDQAAAASPAPDRCSLVSLFTACTKDLINADNKKLGFLGNHLLPEVERLLTKYRADRKKATGWTTERFFDKIAGACSSSYQTRESMNTVVQPALEAAKTAVAAATEPKVFEGAPKNDQPQETFNGQPGWMVRS